MKHWLKLTLNVFEYKLDLVTIGTVAGWAIGGLIMWSWSIESLIGAFAGAFGYSLYLEHRRYKRLKSY